MTDQGSTQFPTSISVLTLKSQMEPIKRRLRDLKKSEVLVLVGEPGTGKTMMAKKIVRGVAEKGPFSKGLWFYTHKNYDDGESFLLDVACQLSLLSWTPELWEDEDDKEKEEEPRQQNRVAEKNKGHSIEEEEKKKKKLLEEERKKELMMKLQQKVSDLLSRKKYLLVLDGCGLRSKNIEDEESTTEEVKPDFEAFYHLIMSKLKMYVREIKTQFPKILITVNCYNWVGESQGSGDSEREGEIIDKFSIIKVEKLQEADCREFLLKKSQQKFFREKSRLPEHPRFDELSRAVFNISKGSPDAVVLMAKALSHIAIKEHPTQEGYKEEDGHGEYRTLERAMDRIIDIETDEDLFRFGYEMLPGAEYVNCCWYSRQLFRQRGAVHEMELISYWIVEGFLGPADCIEKTYRKGSSILKELIKRRMFVNREHDLVCMEEKALSTIDDRCHDITCTSSLGLAILYWNKAGSNPGTRLGRIAQADGALRTPTSSHKKTHLVSTLLMDQNTFLRQVPEELFACMKGLKTLVLFKPILVKLPLSLYKLEKLQILVLRDCEKLQDVEGISDVRTLEVLEISGAGSLARIPDDLFLKLTELICLNLSGSGIKQLPSPSDNPQDKAPILRWLILRGCPCLELLPTLSDFRSLEVIDVSGSASLSEIEDEFFTSIQNLQTINFSGTQITAIPVVGALEHLSRIFLRNCKKLKRLPRLPQGICHLDLFGCTELLELRDESLETKDRLKTIDASETGMHALPSVMPPRLARLGLRGLKSFELSSKTVVPTLQYLDFSTTTTSKDINSEIFGSLEAIQVLNLSGTGVTSLRYLAKCSSLHQLLLAGCGSLRELPDMDALTTLEVLNLSQCAALQAEQLQGLKKLSRLRDLNLSGAWESDVFDVSTILGQMTSLQKLDLSGNRQLEKVLSISILKSLLELSLKDCDRVTELESISELEKLQVLDLSGTALDSVPSIHQNSKSTLRVIDLSRTKVQKFPYQEISGFTVLQRLNLPDLDNIDWKEISKVRLPEELTFDAYGIFTGGESQGNYTDPTPASDSHLEVAVRSIKQHSEEEFMNCYDQQLISVSQALKYSVAGQEYKPVEARGVHAFPVACSSFLNRKQYLSVVDTPSGSLSELGSDIMKDVKRCWLDRCPKMKTIIAGSDEAHKVAESLELLSLSNLPELENMCSKSVAHECFQNLTTLHLDCCPKLIHVFSLPHVPRQLEVLEIRFCDNLKTIFTSDGSDHHLDLKLTKLRLFALPELESAGVIMLRPTNLDDKNGCPKWSPVWEAD